MQQRRRTTAAGAARSTQQQHAVARHSGRRTLHRRAGDARLRQPAARARPLIL